MEKKHEDCDSGWKSHVFVVNITFWYSRLDDYDPYERPENQIGFARDGPNMDQYGQPIDPYGHPMGPGYNNGTSDDDYDFRGYSGMYGQR